MTGDLEMFGVKTMRAVVAVASTHAFVNWHPPAAMLALKARAKIPFESFFWHEVIIYYQDAPIAQWIERMASDH